MPFIVRQKQEPGWNFFNGNVAYVRYVEIHVFGMQFRLLRSENWDIPFTINGVKRNAPYADDTNGINIVKNGGKLLFSTNFGLSIDWDGRESVGYTLCDAYSKYICGLCGNGDGNNGNDYVDRNKTTISNVFNWGQSWKVFDDSVDADQKMYYFFLIKYLIFSC